MLDEYRKPEVEIAYDISDEDIPFSLSIAIPLSSILAFAQLSTNFI